MAGKWKTVELRNLVESNANIDIHNENDEIWNLNLDQIEANSGRVLDKVYCRFNELGTSTHHFEKNTVLYSKLRPYLNKIVIADEAGWATTELVPLKCKEYVNPRYLAYYLRGPTFLAFATGMVAGAKMPRMVMEKFWEYQIPLPPLEEQKRIAAILDSADAIRTKRKAAIAKLDELSQSIFLDMFGDPVKNEKKWGVKKVNQICRLVRGSSPRPQGDPRYFGGPIPRLMVADITRDGWHVTPQIDSLTLEGAKKSRPVPAGTVVMAVSGNVGLVSILNIDACIHDGFAGFTELSPSINSQYLLITLHLLKTTHERVKAGAIFQNITTDNIKDMDIPIPPYSLQINFVNKIDLYTQLKKKYEEAIEYENVLFSSLQQRAFSGEL